MIYKVRERVVFKHDPICVNGKPIIAGCKWNFKLIKDNLMQNTEYPVITLEYNEETEKDFVPLFSLNAYSKVKYNDYNTASIPREEIFIEGEDVRVESPTLMTFAWIPSKYLYDKKLRLFKELLNVYESGKYHSKKVDEFGNLYMKLQHEYSVMTGKSYEEIDKEVQEKCEKKKE